jgi:hypothetical protein
MKKKIGFAVLALALVGAMKFDGPGPPPECPPDTGLCIPPAN